MRRLLFIIGLLLCSVPARATVGCGATNWVSSSSPPTQYDQTTCGNVTTDGSVLSYEPNYNAGAAINLNTAGCGAIYTNSGPVSFVLTADLNCGATSVAFSIMPNNGAGVGYYVNLAGFTVTGTVSVNDNNGGFPDGTHFFGGSWTCSARPCLNIFWTNGADIVTNAMTVHHITWANTNDNGQISSIGANGAGAALVPYTVIYHHNDIMLSGGTSGDPNRTSGIGEYGTLQTVHYFNNKIYNSSGTNHGASEGMVCYNASACMVNNNWVSFNQMMLSNGTPGRAVLLDGDAYGNGGSAAVTLNAVVANNYFSTNDTRAVRIRSASAARVYNNYIDNCTDGPNVVSWQACGTHWGDPTGVQGATATYNYNGTLVYNNVYYFNTPTTNGGRAHWGNNAIGISFQDERIECTGTGCSGNTWGNPYIEALISNKSSTQYYNINACRLTTDYSFTTNITADGTNQSQTSTVNTFQVGSVTVTNGAANNALGSCAVFLGSAILGPVTISGGAVIH